MITRVGRNAVRAPRHQGRGLRRARRSIVSGLSGISAITAVGDVDGDKRSDLVARLSSGKLKLYRSTGSKLVASTTYAGSYRGTRFAL